MVLFHNFSDIALSKRKPYMLRINKNFVSDTLENCWRHPNMLQHLVGEKLVLYIKIDYDF